MLPNLNLFPLDDLIRSCPLYNSLASYYYSTPTPPPLVLPLTYVLRGKGTISRGQTHGSVATHSLLGCHDRTGGNIALVGNTHGPSIAGGLVATKKNQSSS